MTKKRTVASLVALLATAAVAAGGVSAAGEDSAGNQLAGTWRVAVNRPAPLPPLTSLQVFTGEGFAPGVTEVTVEAASYAGDAGAATAVLRLT